MDARQSTPDASYAAALNYLYGRINYERSPGGPPRGRGLSLDRMRKLLAKLGDPQDALRVIHVAGTKGKGLTAAMIAAVLAEAGMQIGLYTSPHLERLEERVQIGGVAISSQELVELVDAIRPVVDELDHEAAITAGLARPTFFEITTALALLVFAQRHVDAAVVEVGLGGRLDSTNVCQPQIAVITSISLDHTRQLGNTLSQIAIEKAGIIKQGVPVVSGVTQAEPRRAIADIAQQLAAPAIWLGDDFCFRYQPAEAVDLLDSAGGSIDFEATFGGQSLALTDLRLGMLGSHQAVNAAVALATLQQLRIDGWQIPDSALRRGLAATSCHARVEVVSRQPTVVLDTAHNVASVEALLAVLDESFAAQRRILVFAATRDKDVKGMLKRLLPRFELIILTRYADNPRAVPPCELFAMTESLLAESPHVCEVVIHEQPEAAWQHCQTVVTVEHLVVVTGSFFLAAEIRPVITSARAVTLS